MTQPTQEFYDRHPLVEWERLDTPYSRIEFLSTLRLIAKYFPTTGQIADVGGGPGRYTIELTKQGYAVTLVDLSPACIAMAQEKLNSLGLRAEKILCGDARDLSALASSSFDAALLLGPLYHLKNGSDRAVALRELLRILRPGGTAIVAYLNSWGMFRTGVNDFPARFEDPSFIAGMLDQGGIGIWSWVSPARAREEIAGAGFEVVSHAGAEGPAGGIRTIIQQMAKEHPKAYEELARFAAEASELPQFRDMTDHLHFVVRRPRHSNV